MPGRPKNSRKSYLSKKERYKEHVEIRNDQEFNDQKPKKDEKKADNEPKESE